MEWKGNGTALYYEDCGQGKPVVLVHGNGESHEIFDVLIRELSRTHRVIAPDSRGHGRSMAEDHPGYGQMAGDCRQLIRDLGLEKPIFYGFSDGGIIGLLLAMQDPELLGKLIISGANLNPRGLTLPTRLEILMSALRGSKLDRMMLREPHIDPAELGNIRIPTVVLAGEHDVIRRSHTEKIARSIPGSTLEILPGEGHGSYIVHSEKLHPILKKYL